MKDLKAMKYLRHKHGRLFDENDHDIHHSLSGFIAGWEAAIETAMSLPKTKENYVLILNHVSDKTGVSIVDMKSDSRKRTFVNARATFANTCKILLVNANVKSIGKCIDKPHDVTLHYLNEMCDTVSKEITSCVISFYKKHL